MRALVIGGDGQIGRALYERMILRDYAAVATTRRTPPALGLVPFDLQWHGGYLPWANVTFFCTGINGHKACEADPEQARKVNVDGPLWTARRAVDAGSKPVFLSSSVAETHSHTLYGALKREAEDGFLDLGGRCYRFGPVAFPGKDVWPNEVYSPISPDDLVERLLENLDGFRPGVVSLYNRAKWPPVNLTHPRPRFASEPASV